MMVGYRGTSPSASILEWVERRGLGGIKVFGWNAEDTDVLARAVAELQGKALSAMPGVPLLVATDQEGGWIRHIKGATSESPGNMAIGATRSRKDAYLTGRYIGEELRSLGVNMNFAPDADLATEPDSSIIGPRAFSDDPGLTSRLALAYAEGSLSVGVIPTAKHFPGHGATKLDSHGALPLVDVDPETFRRRELAPFGYLSGKGIPAMMSGHLAFPKVAGDDLPASLSPTLIGGLLRKELGYEGLVVTDDLYMAGAEASGSIVESCVHALLAGNDMVLLSSEPELSGGLWLGLISRYRKDQAFARRVREGAKRVLATKLLYLRPWGKKDLVPDQASLAKVLPAPGAQAFFSDLARRAATLVFPRASLPFRPSGKVLLAGPLQSFVTRGRLVYPGAEGFVFSGGFGAKDASDEELEEFGRLLEGCEAAVVCVGNRAGMEFAEAARAKGKKVAIVSVLSPAKARTASWAEAVVAVYHYAPICLDAGFSVLSGRLKARGKLPLSLSGQRK